MSHDLKVARAEREVMRATMEAQATRIQEVETRVLEECQRADASQAHVQAIDGRLIRIVKEVRDHVDSILAECGIMADQ